MFDLITIGASTIDNFIKIHDANVRCSIDKTNCQLCVNYADKIGVDEYVSTAGGNGANNAVGSARLGLNTAIYTVYGNDQVGDFLEHTLKSENVNLTYSVVEKGGKSDTGTVLRFQAERTILVYHEKRHYKLPEFKPSKWVYYTSLMKGFEVIHNDLIKYLKESGAKLAFNPGTYQLVAGKHKLEEILKHTELFIVNKEEAQRFLEITSSNINELLSGLHRLGPKNVVITDGPKGSYSFDGNHAYFLDIFDGPIVERTGCGDSYSTGMIAAMVSGKDLKEGMIWGTFNGWSVVQYVGPQAGLLKKTQMQKLLEENPRFKPRLI